MSPVGLSNMQILNPGDMISQLPDDILIPIISLIPTKEALATRILSKRWRDVFRFMADVTFSRTCNKYKCTWDAGEFINGVHNVLQGHSVNIRSFYLCCCLSESFAHTMEQCFVSLGVLGIQNLSLCLPCYQTSVLFEIPFSCNLISLIPSLQKFKLSHYGSWLPSLETPCNSLKTLSLSDLILSPGSFECILTNCSSLCTLSLKMCKVPSKLCFPRINLQLKYIVIHGCRGLEEIDFYAANLTTLDLDCQSELNLIFYYVPQLHKVYLFSKPEVVPYFCGRLAKDLPGLKTLLLDNTEDIYQDGSVGMGINMFSNLKRLELTVSIHYCNLLSLIRVVHACPRLEEFQLATAADHYLWPEEEKQVIVHSQLKVVEISGFGGSESQVGFVTYILKSAVKLQQMFISCYESVYLGCGKWEASDYPPSRCNKWSQLNECIQQMKLEAVSNTLQVIAQEFPQTKSKQF